MQKKRYGIEKAMKMIVIVLIGSGGIFIRKHCNAKRIQRFTFSSRVILFKYTFELTLIAGGQR